MEFPIINHPFWATSNLGNHQITSSVSHPAFVVKTLHQEREDLKQELERLEQRVRGKGHVGGTWGDLGGAATISDMFPRVSKLELKRNHH